MNLPANPLQYPPVKPVSPLPKLWFRVVWGTGFGVLFGCLSATIFVGVSR